MRGAEGAEVVGPTEAVVVRLGERFEQFYEREYHRVVGFAYAVAGSWEAAEDATQEAFLRAHRDWGRIGRYDQPGAWVRRVAANLAISAFRRRLAEARALVHLAARRTPDPPLQPEAVDFWRAVRSLPSRQRQAAGAPAAGRSRSTSVSATGWSRSAAGRACSWPTRTRAWSGPSCRRPGRAAPAWPWTAG
jgi:Sigma-70 region 2